MTVKEELIEKIKILMSKADANVSIDEEIRDVVHTLNDLRQSRRVFQVCIAEGQFLEAHVLMLAELIEDDKQLNPFWKDYMTELLNDPGSTQSSTERKKPLTLPKMSMYNGQPGEFNNWWSRTQQLLASNYIPVSQWPGALLGQVGGSTLASDALLAIMKDERNKDIPAHEMVEKMVQKMTDLFDNIGPDNGIDKLCSLKQQPNETVREFRARFERLLNTLARLGVDFPEKM